MRYLVIGAGMAGLAAAHALIDRRGVSGNDVRVLEADHRVGGCLKPATLEGRVVDAGPDALLTRRPEGVELLRSLGLQDRTISPATGSAYLASKTGLAPYPPGLLLGVPLRPQAVDTPTLTSEGSARALEGFELPETRDARDVSVFDLVARRWGDEVAGRLAGPLIAAVHAGRAEYLSAQACAPQLFPDARPAPPHPGADGSPFVSLDGGLWQLADHIRKFIEGAGAVISTGAPVLELARRPAGWIARTESEAVEADRVVLAVPAPAAARLLQPIVPAAADLLASVEYASVAIATVLLSKASRFPEGSGFLVGPAAGGERLLTACTWVDQKWPETARPDGRIVRLSAGRHGDARFEGFDDADLVDRLVKDLGELSGQHLDVNSALVTRFPSAFPQYEVGHLDKVRRLRDDLHRTTLGTISLCGNAYQGVGLPAVIASAHAAAAAATADT